ncbi:MAG: DHH family phosphoesterase [Acidobacteria bacterium]|nr:DHH family phosphoesterase [Acidobacteriota bacterium]
MNDPLRRLLALDLGRGPLLVLTHDNPDPDSIASAAGLALLLSEVRGIDATVGYSGIIGRAENRAMVEMLHLPVRHIAELDLDGYQHFALIDAQPNTGNSVVDDGHIPDIVIDHHPLREATRRARFFDVREALGASATIVTGYLREAGIAIPRDLATALLYGIRSETQDLGREASDDDFDAYIYLFHLADTQKLAAISRPALDPRYFTQLATALDSLMVGERVSVCQLDNVMDPDFVPEMADFAVRLTGIEWSLVTGQYAHRLHLSIRSNVIEANAGELMQLLLEGLGRGGGHGMRGGGNIDLTTVELTLHELQERLCERFLRLTGRDAETLVPMRAHPRGRIEPPSSVVVERGTKP